MPSVILAGTTTGTALSLTSDTSGELQIRTNNGSTTAMTLTTGGNVGIGTTTPEEILRINGSSNGTSRIRLLNQGTVFGALGSQLGFFGSGGANDLLLYGNDNTTVGSGGIVAFTTSGATERMRIDSAGLVGIGTSTPYYPLSLPTSNNTYQATGTQLGFGNSGFSGYGPHIGTANRAYVHFTGPGGGSANSTWIHGYQVANPAGSNWIRVANGISGNPVTGFTIVDGAAYFYLDNNKTTGNPDYSPTLRSGQNQNGYFVGNTPGNSGTGYTFPATQDPSSNANTLDDYEEGTWTPDLRGSSTAGTVTYSADGRIGRYTKIGNVCKFQIYIAWTNWTGSPSGGVQVAGLPFASKATTSNYTAINVYMDGAYTLSANNIMQGYINQNVTYVFLGQYVTGGGNSTDLGFDTNSALMISGIYEVN
jgi:hypothetical protein